MKLSSLLFVASTLSPFAVSALTSADVPELLSFSEWKTLFNKTYCDEATELAAQQAFANNVKFIERHNAEEEQGQHGFRCGVNQVRYWE